MAPLVDSVPTELPHVLEVAAIAFHRNATVSGPPPPPQGARLTFEVHWDLKAHLHRAWVWNRRQIPAFLLPLEHWLALPALVVRNAVVGRSHALQLDLAHAVFGVRRVMSQELFADAELEVPLVVRGQFDHEVHNLASPEVCLGPLDVAQMVTMLRPLAAVATNAFAVPTLLAPTVSLGVGEASHGREIQPSMRGDPPHHVQLHHGGNATPHFHRIFASDLGKKSA